MDDITLLDVREKFPKSYKEFETWYLERESGLYPWLPIRNYWKDITDWMDINSLYFESVHRGDGLYGYRIFDNKYGCFFADYTLESRNDSESNGLFKLFELREAQLWDYSATK